MSLEVLNSSIKTTFDENLNVRRWDSKYSTNVNIGKIIGALSLLLKAAV